MSIKFNDFCYIRRGKVASFLLESDVNLPAAITQHNRKDKKHALLLLHGFSSSPAVYRKMLPQLAMYDYIYSPLLPGHGTSIKDFAATTGASWIKTAEEACTRLLDEYQKVDVIGLSLGGMLACKLAAKHQFNHVWLLAPALALKQNISHMLMLARILKTLGFCAVRNVGGDIMNHNTELTYRRLPVTAVREVFTLIQNFQLQPPLCPIDIFLGRHDAVVDSEAVSHYFANRTDCVVHWLEHSAHVLPLDYDVATIIDHVKSKFDAP